MNQKKRLPIRTLSDMEQEKETIQLTILSECIKNKLELADAIIKAPAVTPKDTRWKIFTSCQPDYSQLGSHT